DEHSSPFPVNDVGVVANARLYHNGQPTRPILSVLYRRAIFPRCGRPHRAKGDIRSAEPLVHLIVWNRCHNHAVRWNSLSGDSRQYSVAIVIRQDDEFESHPKVIECLLENRIRFAIIVDSTKLADVYPDDISI